MYYFYPYDDDDDDDDFDPWDDDDDDDEDGIFAPGHFGGSATREKEDSDDGNEDDEDADDNGNKKKRNPEDEGDGTGFGDDIGDGFGEDDNPDKDEEEKQKEQKEEKEQDEEVEGEVKGKSPGLIKKIQMKRAIKKNANKYTSFAGFVRHTNLTCPGCGQKSIYRSMALSDMGLFFVGPWAISAISGTPVPKYYAYYCTNGKKFCDNSIENRKAWLVPTDTPPMELPKLQTKVLWRDFR